MLPERAQDVLTYWFEGVDQTPEYFRKRNRIWFMGGKAVDDFIASAFSKDVEEAASGLLRHWGNTPEGNLALILLLDQFSLNIYRDSARGYLHSELSLPIAKDALNAGWASKLSLAKRIFLYMPFEHSEHMEDQIESVKLFAELAESSPPELSETMKGYLEFAKRHYQVVKEFGRFPHRNAALRRESSAEERKFLSSGRAPF